MQHSRQYPVQLSTPQPSSRCGRYAARTIARLTFGSASCFTCPSRSARIHTLCSARLLPPARTPSGSHTISPGCSLRSCSWLGASSASPPHPGAGTTPTGQSGTTREGSKPGSVHLGREAHQHVDGGAAVAALRMLGAAVREAAQELAADGQTDTQTRNTTSLGRPAHSAVRKEATAAHLHRGVERAEGDRTDRQRRVP